VLVAVRVAVMCMVVIVFMFVHGKHSFLKWGRAAVRKNHPALNGLSKVYHILL